MSILIRGGRILDPANQLNQIDDLYVADGKIIALGASALEFSADLEVDAKGLIVAPGFVDIGTYLPEPGYEHKGTIASETLAAAAAGYTSVCNSPDTDPIIDSPSVATLVQDLALEKGSTHVYPIGALTKQLAGSQLSEMSALKQAGCIGVTNLRQPFENNRVLLRCLEYAASLDLLVLFSPVDSALQEAGCVHQGSYATQLGLAGVPPSAECVALARDLLLVEQTGVRAHFGPLSTGRAIDLIADAQQRGLKVTADVCIQHLLETEAAISDFNSLYHIQPPLRTESDRAILREALNEGVLSAIRSGHKPHEAAAKLAPFAATEEGISSLESVLPLGLQLVRNNVLELPLLIERLSLGPAKIVSLPAGTLSVGEAADICIFADEENWRLTPETILSNGHNSPLLNQELRGRVRYTYLAGRRVYQSQRL